MSTGNEEYYMMKIFEHQETRLQLTEVGIERNSKTLQMIESKLEELNYKIGRIFKNMFPNAVSQNDGNIDATYNRSEGIKYDKPEKSSIDLSAPCSNDPQC